MASGSFAASARLTNRLLGVRVEVIGLDKLDPHQAYVFTPDHRSHVDITALMAALPRVRFAAKRELFDEPVLGAAMRALGMIPIDRDDPALAKRTLDEAAAKLGRTVSVVIFPEGTRAPAGQMLPLKGGAFVFAIEQQVPVVPVALHNTAQVMPAHGYLTILGGRVVVEILDPIPTAGLAFEDRHRLKEQVHEALVQALRPEDGGVADRRDLGSFAGHAFGVRRRRDSADHVARTAVAPRSSSHAWREDASMRPNVTVIGAGSWGTTLASMCARHGPTTIWALEDEVAREINARHTNSLYLKGFELTRGATGDTSDGGGDAQAPRSLCWPCHRPTFGPCSGRRRLRTDARFRS